MANARPMVRATKIAAALFTMALAAGGGGVLAATAAPQPAPAQQAGGSAAQWPRTLDFHGTHYEVYQPQVDTWTGNRITGRMAIAIGPANGQPTYGVANFSADADVDKAAGEVHLTQLQIARVQIPTEPDKAQAIQEQFSARLPVEMTLRLSDLQLSYAASRHVADLRAVPVKNTPPRIFVRSTPAVLVMIDGQPVLGPVKQVEGWQRVINSRALILRSANGTYHLNAAGYWYTSRSLSDGWRSETPSRGLLNVAAAAARQAPVDPLLAKGAPRAPQPPAMLVSSEPAELVLLQGPAQMRPVQGTNLLAVNNADHALFMLPADNRYYLLISGRWFSAAQLDGTWKYVPGDKLSPDFARIGIHDPQAGVLASVPGTPQAKEAVIASTIPQTATVSRSKATLHVDYIGGAPKFDRIAGTSLRYATNTAVPVIQADGGQYYALSRAVWFTADSAQGPWRVADSVPSAIYGIPPESPLHYVTYVQIYGSTPDSVVVGYTPGYMGLVESPDGTVVYGTGYVYPPVVVDDAWIGYPPTYGYNAALDTAAGFAFGFAMADAWGPEPYWGPYAGFPYARGVDVNQTNVYGAWGREGTVTRTVGYNDWTGNEWRTAHAQGYNPTTGRGFEGSRGADYNAYSGNYVAGQRDAYRNTGTGVSGASRSGIEENDDGQWNAGRQSVRTNSETGRTTVSGTTASGTAGEHDSSVDRRGVEHDSQTGNSVAWNNGNIYGDHDGHVYQHTADGGWQQHTASGWQPMQRSDFSSSNVSSYLDGQRQARTWSDDRFAQQRSDTGWGGDRFGGDRFGGGGGGWAGRGFGGRGWGGRR
ncbi:carbohydrate-binding family V/XII [Bordetella sp. BOR01]|uniref:carbohydrate-binding family V/XII n=1 Tax=Bordetella sp. BOR01 TaxID=2854779 RepID=UPI001C48B903|nr:carbohydrate-binding family V/XII [Bordetella sp. BOR01]MBV7483846.1 carbohydrate-binding family V/XII [Bordetella sp. BOR01]